MEDIDAGVAGRIIGDDTFSVGTPGDPGFITRFVIEDEDIKVVADSRIDEVDGVGHGLALVVDESVLDDKALGDGVNIGVTGIGSGDIAWIFVYKPPGDRLAGVVKAIEGDGGGGSEEEEDGEGREEPGHFG